MRQLHANGMSRQRKKEAAVLLTVLVSARGRDGFLGIRSVGSASFCWLANGSDFLKELGVVRVIEEGGSKWFGCALVTFKLCKKNTTIKY